MENNIFETPDFSKAEGLAKEINEIAKDGGYSMRTFWIAIASLDLVIKYGMNGDSYVEMKEIMEEALKHKETDLYQ